MALALPVVIWLAHQEDTQWRAWAAEHCKVTRRIAGSSSFGTAVVPSSNGVSVAPVSTYEPARTCWLCDDGVEYCR